MLALIEAHPRAAAITGQPGLPPGARLPFVEKLNVVANLMVIFPADTANELIPVGFAEGRCDVFRVEALREAGLYDTRLRVSGEDQVLAAKLREKGYEVYQAPGLTYHLSVSAEQDSALKILRHQRERAGRLREERHRDHDHVDRLEMMTHHAGRRPLVHGREGGGGDGKARRLHPRPVADALACWTGACQESLPRPTVSPSSRAAPNGGGVDDLAQVELPPDAVDEPDLRAGEAAP